MFKKGLHETILTGLTMQVDKSHVMLASKFHELGKAVGKVEERDAVAAFGKGLRHGGRALEGNLTLSGPAACHKKDTHSVHQNSPILSKITCSMAFARVRYPVMRALRSSSVP